MKDNTFDLAAAIYWYCSDYHGGQNSKEYAILSKTIYKPAPSENCPPTPISQTIYNLIVEDNNFLEDFQYLLEFKIETECG